MKHRTYPPAMIFLSVSSFTFLLHSWTIGRSSIKLPPMDIPSVGGGPVLGSGGLNGCGGGSDGSDVICCGGGSDGSDVSMTGGTHALPFGCGGPNVGSIKTLF